MPTLHILHNSEFRIQKFVVWISEFVIQNCEIVWKWKVSHLGHHTFWFLRLCMARSQPLLSPKNRYGPRETYKHKIYCVDSQTAWLFPFWRYIKWPLSLRCPNTCISKTGTPGFRLHKHTVWIIIQSTIWRVIRQAWLSTMASAFIARGRSILYNYWLGRHWICCDIHQRISILTEMRPSGNLLSFCAIYADQSLNFMLMIFWNSWIGVCIRQLWSVCSALI